MEIRNTAWRDLGIAIIAFISMEISLRFQPFFNVYAAIPKFWFYSSMLIFLFYVERLRLAAIGIDPDSKMGLRKILILGLVVCLCLFAFEAYRLFSVAYQGSIF